MGKKLFAGSKGALERAAEMRGIFHKAKPPTRPTRAEVSAAGVVLRGVPSPEHWNRSLGPDHPAKKPSRAVRARLIANLTKGRRKKASKSGSAPKRRKARKGSRGPAHLRQYQFKKGGGRVGSARKSSSRKPRARRARKARKSSGSSSESRRAMSAAIAKQKTAARLANQKLAAARAAAEGAIRKSVVRDLKKHRLPKIAVDRAVSKAIRQAEEDALVAKYGGAPARSHHADEAALAAKYG